jgi:hypothetical protein
MARAKVIPPANQHGNGSHIYEQQLKNWITRDDPNRDKSITSGSIRRDELDAAIKKQTGR